MKNLVIYVSLLLTSFCLSAQHYWWEGSVYWPNLFNPDSLNLRNYEDKYLLPCCNGSTINLNILDANANLVNQERDIYIHEIYDDSYLSPNYDNLIHDYAQPYITDTTISIIGISGYTLSAFTELSAYDMYRFYYEIRDSTLENILAQVDVTNTNLRFSDYKYESLCYTEKFFDTAINVSGKFYVVYHGPDTLVIAKDGYSLIYGTTNCQVEDYPLMRRFEDWRLIGSSGAPIYFYIDGQDTITMLYLFPILASEEDTNSSGLQNVDISAYTHIFPSPAEEEFNVNCGYKIKTLSILDEQGKLLAENQVNAYNYQVNLNNYSSGTYFIRVVTNKGQTVKKLIKL